MRRVDVPRVPGHRVVVVELEGVAGRRERLPPRRQVDEAAQPPVGSEHRAQVRVLEGDRAVVLPARRDAVVRLRHDPALAARGQLGERQSPVRPCHHRAPRRPADRDWHVARRPEHTGRDGVGAGDDGVEVGAGAHVDLRDARAGQDVVELVEQQDAPQPVELRLPAAVAAQRVERLRILQRPLAAPVAALHRGLRRVRAAVVLEVELAHDRPQIPRVGREVVEERIRRPQLRLRQPGEVAHPPQPLEHLRGRPAAAVAVAEDQQRVARARMILVRRHGAAQLGHGRLRVVRVGGREVREDLAPVEPLPGERMALRRREAVPGEFLREEAVDAREAHELRELRGVAEHVGQPQLGAAAAEVLLEPALAVEELAGQRLPRGQVAVGLHPHRADREPLPARDRLAHAGEERRRALRQPRVVLCLRVREAVLGIRVHQPQLRGRRAHELAPRLLERPQPRRVEVGVADRAHPVQLARAAAEEPGQPAAVAVERERVQLGEEQSRPGGVDARLALQRPEHLEVVPLLPRPGVEAGELAARAARTTPPHPGPPRRSRTGRCRRARARTGSARRPRRARRAPPPAGPCAARS